LVDRNRRMTPFENVRSRPPETGAIPTLATKLPWYVACSKE
jgi:hypothetical protein